MGILSEEAKEKLMSAVVGKRAVTLDKSTEVYAYREGRIVKITINEEGGIDIYGEGLTLSLVKVHPNHVILIPRRNDIDDAT